MDVCVCERDKREKEIVIDRERQTNRERERIWAVHRWYALSPPRLSIEALVSSQLSVIGRRETAGPWPTTPVRQGWSLNLLSGPPRA